MQTRKRTAQQCGLLIHQAQVPNPFHWIDHFQGGETMTECPSVRDDLLHFKGDPCSTLPNTWSSILQHLQQYHSLPALLQVHYWKITLDVIPESERLFSSLGAVSLDTLLQMFVSQERVSMLNIIRHKLNPSFPG